MQWRYGNKKVVLKFCPSLHVNYHMNSSVFGNKCGQKREENTEKDEVWFYAKITFQFVVVVAKCLQENSVSKSFVFAVILNTRFCVFVFLYAIPR